MGGSVVTGEGALPVVIQAESLVIEGASAGDISGSFSPVSLQLFSDATPDILVLRRLKDGEGDSARIEDSFGWDLPLYDEVTAKYRGNTIFIGNVTNIDVQWSEDSEETIYYCSGLKWRLTWDSVNGTYAQGMAKETTTAAPIRVDTLTPVFNKGGKMNMVKFTPTASPIHGPEMSFDVNNADTVENWTYINAINYLVNRFREASGIGIGEETLAQRRKIWPPFINLTGNGEEESDAYIGLSQGFTTEMSFVNKTYLEAIDFLIASAGYYWQIIDGTFVFYRRSDKAAKDVYLPPVGSLLSDDGVQANAFRGRINFDGRNSVNRFVGYSANEEIETDFTLLRSWDEDQENQKRTNYMPTSIGNLVQNYFVYRRFTLDEMGKYNQTGREAYDFATLFGESYIIRPRPFRKDCLTRLKDKDGFESDTHAPPILRLNGTPFNPAVHGPFIQLEEEAGIIASPISIYIAQPANEATIWTVTYTAVIQSDTKLIADTLTPSGDYASQAGIEIVRRIEMGDAYKKQIRKTDSMYDPEQSGVAEADDPYLLNAVSGDYARNDQAQLDALMDDKKKYGNGLQISGNIILPYLTDHYMPGDSIKNVSGRNLSLDDGTGRFPVIVGLTLSFDDQTTEIILGDERSRETGV